MGHRLSGIKNIKNSLKFSQNALASETFSADGRKLLSHKECSQRMFFSTIGHPAYSRHKHEGDSSFSTSTSFFIVFPVAHPGTRSWLFPNHREGLHARGLVCRTWLPVGGFLPQNLGVQSDYLVRRQQGSTRSRRGKGMAGLFSR